MNGEVNHVIRLSVSYANEFKICHEEKVATGVLIRFQVTTVAINSCAPQ